MEYWKWQQFSVVLVLITVNSSHTTRVNIAFNKPTRQSSLGPKSQTQDGYSYKAVDGNMNGKYNDGSCTHNQDFFVNGTEWWEVDLKEVYNITEVIVYSRSDTCCLNWLDDYVLYSGVNCETGICYSECYNYNKTQETIKVNLIPEGCIAQHIRLSVVHKSLVLCEVQIFGELIPIVSSTLLSSTDISSDGQGMTVTTSEHITKTLLGTNSLFNDVTTSFYTVADSSSTDSIRMTSYSYTSDLEYIDIDPTISSLGSTILSSLNNQITPSLSYVSQPYSDTDSLLTLLPTIFQSHSTTILSYPIQELSPTTPASVEITSYFDIISSTQEVSSVRTSQVPQSPDEATISSTIAISTTSSNNCSCLCSTLTLEGIQEKLNFITQSLTLPKDDLSSFRRKKTTADDNRFSAVVAGYTGTAILCCVFGFLVSSDVLTLLRLVVKLFRKSKSNY